MRYTCSARCRQIRKRYGDWKTWSAEMEYRKKRVEANQKIRKLERRVGSLDFEDNPKFPGLSRRDRLRIRIMQGHEPKTCAECRMPYVTDTWRKYPVCSGACYRRHKKRILYLDDWCWEHMPKRGWLDRTMYINDHIRDTLCAHCGWPFYNRDTKRKYCTDRCKDAAYWKRRPLKTCGGCGVKYRGLKVGCSVRCRGRVKRDTWYRCGRCPKLIRPGAEIVPNADTRIPPGFAHRKRKEQPLVFCSGRCRDRLGWSPIRKMCEECHQGFYALSREAYSHSKYCQSCAKRLKSRRKVEKMQAKLPPVFCRWCGTGIARTKRIGQPFYCSSECKRNRVNERQREHYAVHRQAALMVPEHIVRGAAVLEPMLIGAELVIVDRE